MVTTIHQPNSMIAALFDDLLLLSRGRVVYHGDASRAVDHFNTHKFWCGSPCNTVILPVVLLACAAWVCGWYWVLCISICCWGIY